MTKLSPGPDPEPRKPKLPVPPGSCDTHAHVFGPVEKYPYHPDRAYTPADAPLAEFERMLRILGMERAVLVQPSVYGTDNSAQLEAIAAATLEMRGVAVVEADISDRELERLHAAGMRGVRCNLKLPAGLPLDALGSLAERIKDLGWHIQFFMDVNAFPDLEAMLAALPVDSVIDHIGKVPPEQGMAHPGFQGLLNLLREGRCWVKLSGAYRSSKQGSPYADVAPMARMLIETAPERMVWATDWPHPGLEVPVPNDGDLCDQLAEWAPDPEVRRKILVDNPSALYGF